MLEPRDEREDARDESSSDEGAPETEEQADLRAQMEEALREKEQFRSMAQRAQADLINYKRRVEEEEKPQLLQSFKAGLILKLLPIIDDYHRAFSYPPPDNVDPGWLEGVQLVLRKLETLLESEGVTRIEALDKEFDPREHEAVSFEESPHHQAGKVVSVIRDGYRLRDKVLRPAQVTVSQPTSTAAPNDTPENEETEV